MGKTGSSIFHPDLSTVYYNNMLSRTQPWVTRFESNNPRMDNNGRGREYIKELSLFLRIQLASILLAAHCSHCCCDPSLLGPPNVPPQSSPPLPLINPSIMASPPFATLSLSLSCGHICACTV